MSGPPPMPAGDLALDVDVPGRVQACAVAAAGSVVAVLGPNGAGKSSLLGAVAGTVPAAGSVRLGATEWHGLPPQRRSVGLVPQGQLLFPHLSALDNVGFGLRARGTGRRQAAALAGDWLDRLGLTGLEHRRPAALSGGQAQRVALARALVTDPAVLLLDEPFTGLDLGVATGLRHTLGEVLAGYAGVTLLVTHDPVDALLLSDTLWVLEDAALAQAGPSAEVAARPGTDHVARLVGVNVVTEGTRARSFPPSAVTVSLAPVHDSTRLRWEGTVRSAVPHGDAVRLRVATAKGRELLADVTALAVAELGLVEGRAVHLSVKATATSTWETTPAATRSSPVTGGSGPATVRP